jgi:hypothetical protein
MRPIMPQDLASSAQLEAISDRVIAAIITIAEFGRRRFRM